MRRLLFALFLLAAAPAWGQSIAGNGGTGIGGNPTGGSGSGCATLTACTAGAGPIAFGAVSVTGSNFTITGGSISVPTITATTAFNVPVGASYKQNSSNALRIFGSGANNPIAIGPLAGATMDDSSSYAVFMGYQSGQLSAGGELVCIGGLTCTKTTSGHIVAVGLGCMWYETDGAFNACFGPDTMRNSVGQHDDAAFGNNDMIAFFGVNSIAVGSNTLDGNSSATLFTGTPTNGEVITATITSPNLNGGVGLPIPVTVSGSPSIQTLITTIQTALNSNSALAADNIIAFNDTLIPGILSLNHQGTSTIGDTISVAFTSSTGATTFSTSGGVSASAQDLIAIGRRAMLGYQMVNPSHDIAIGAYVMANLISSTNSLCEGDFACQNLATGNRITAGGYTSQQSNIAGSDSTSYGFATLNLDVTGTNSAFGSGAGQTISVNGNGAFFGLSAGKYATGARNTATGALSQQAAAGNPETGGSNTSDGYDSLANCTSCTHVVAIGDSSVLGSSGTPNTGQNIVAVGDGSGKNLIGTSHDLTFVGTSVGQACTNGAGVVLALGTSSTTNCSSSNETFAIHIGAGSTDIFKATGTGTPGTSISMIAGAFQTGSTTALTMAGGELGMTKITASGTAPGAAGGKLSLVCGTNAGTLKLIISGGTSGTAVTVTDNVGAGVTGC